MISWEHLRHRELIIRPLPEFPVDVALKGLTKYHNNGTRMI